MAVIQLPGEHSAQAPAGPQAFLLDRLADLLYLISAVVFVLVVAALLAAIFRRRRADAGRVGGPEPLPCAPGHAHQRHFGPGDRRAVVGEFLLHPCQ